MGIIFDMTYESVIGDYYIVPELQRTISVDIRYVLLITNLDYSRIEFAADARHRECGCGSPPQMPCNEADAVKSARPKGKLCRHIIKRNTLETD